MAQCLVLEHPALLNLSWLESIMPSRTHNLPGRLNSYLIRLSNYSEIVLGLAGLMVAGIFSRRREFRADSDSARLVGRDKIIKALECLKEIKAKEDGAEALPSALAALGVSGKRGFLALLSTHPPLEKRIDALKCS